MERKEMISLLKAGAWERAKGALREVASLAGQHSSVDNEGTRWKNINECVEDFIKCFEDEGYEE